MTPARLLSALAGVLLATARASQAEPAAGAVRPAADDGVFERATVEVAPAKKPIRLVTVDNPLGDLRIEGHDGPGVVILAYKRAPDEATLDRLRVSLIPDPDGAIHISTAVDHGREVKAVARGAVRIDLVIRAPRDARIGARVRDGKLELVNMDAGGELDTARGTIDVENVAGAVSAHSVAGDQNFQAVFGTIDAQALDADVKLDAIRGAHLVASVHAGRIAGTHVTSRRVELRTTRGDIVFDGEAFAGGELVLATLHGDVEMMLRASRVRVRASGAQVALPAGGHPDHGDEGATIFGGAGGARGLAGVVLRSKFGSVRFALAE